MPAVAFAKLVGDDWSHLMRKTTIILGRKSRASKTGTFHARKRGRLDGGSFGAREATSVLDVDLGPSKLVSRLAARITWNAKLRCVLALGGKTKLDKSTRGLG